MSTLDHRIAPRPAATTHARRWLKWLFLGLLTAHFVLIQLLTGVQFGDATRNLHWGLLTWEDPTFLLGTADPFARTKGFVPDPPSLAPMGFAGATAGGLHRWWGPVTPGLFAGVWAISRSYTMLQLVIPLAAGAAVFLSYQFTHQLLGRRAALIAAAFLSFFPLFRDYGTVSYNEALGTLWLSAALFAYSRGHTALAVLGASLAALTKMDLVVLYLGSVTVVMLYDRLWGQREQTWQQHLIALLGPLLVAAPWIWFHYLGAGSNAPSRGLSLALFTVIAPQMFELILFIPWYGTLLTLIAIGWVVLVGLRAPLLPPLIRVLCTTWFLLGLVILLIYCATPGAGNSPRVILPALPTLVVLFAAGFQDLPRIWQRRIGFYLIALFTVINLTSIGYRFVTEGMPIRAIQPALADLRERERGFVLTPRFWETILYARQPATWFEFDSQFEQHIMGDAEQFARYVTTNPIRYVLLPAQASPAAPAVLSYLDTYAERHSFGYWMLWVLPAP